MIDAYLDRNYATPPSRPATAPAAARVEPRPSVGERTRRARSWTATAGRRARSLANAAARPLLVVSGLGFITASAWDLARPAGLLVAGLACLTFDYLRGDPS